MNLNYGTCGANFDFDEERWSASVLRERLPHPQRHYGTWPVLKNSYYADVRMVTMLIRLLWQLSRGLCGKTPITKIARPNLCVDTSTVWVENFMGGKIHDKYACISRKRSIPTVD